ncbi:ankyrin repeat-containing protein [Tanacetum coccineum]
MEDEKSTTIYVFLSTKHLWKGDWKAAKDIFDKNKELIRYSINGNNETTLHVAVSRRKTMFVENLMTLMEEKDLELQDNNSYTALCIAVTAGDVQMAKILVRKNKALHDIPTTQGMMPIQMAASFGKQDMTKFLYDSQSMRDVALQLLKDHPELVLNRGSMLRVLAQKPQAFEPKPPSGINSVLEYVPLVHRPLNWEGCPAWKLLSIILSHVVMRISLAYYTRSLLPFSFREKRNVDGFTPGQEFTKHHQYLVDEGEKMMKGTRAQLMVVATLSATITFAGAGYPVLRNDFAYSDYMIYSCISFLLASASIVNILSLLSSRYAQHNFLTSLPNKWMISVLTIYLSIVNMIGAFVSNLDILFGRRSPVLSNFLGYTTFSILCYTVIPMLYIMAPFLRNGISRYDRRSMPSYRA